METRQHAGTAMTSEEKAEVLHLLDSHQRTIEVCRACAQTARDLAWEVKRGNSPAPDSLKQTITEAERVLDDLGKLELALAEMRAAL